jgi:DNA-binding NarL/FixJ family response regulator
MGRFKALIVTAEGDLARVARERLRSGGWSSGVEAADLPAALDRLVSEAVQVVLVDAGLEPVCGGQVLRRIVREYPDRPVLLVVDECNLRNATLALGGGALGCIAREAPPEEWCKAVATVSRGELWVPRGILAQIVKRLMLRAPQRTSSMAATEPLTEREREIADCALGGLSNKEIGLRLEICDSTVKTHLHHVYAKLGLHRRTQLIGVASRPESAASSLD